ncbi:hypothetical protein EF834_13350 [Rhodococcus spongiicola]|uniref:Uncharacterized protein n=1 Tax=Rhodococcus spongiicola TaxID=2487352 RepID=A0A438AV67_9NOCA|nr:hypothetical protein EF834_13350 [Rhodococcus spongiicola]
MAWTVWTQLDLGGWPLIAGLTSSSSKLEARNYGQARADTNDATLLRHADRDNRNIGRGHGYPW